MAAELLYFVSLSLFAFAILGATQVPEGIWLVACIFPVFLAMIMGFFMWIFAWGQFNPVVSVGSLIVPVVAIVLLRRQRLSTPRMFILICAATAVGMLAARFAFIAADIG